MNYRRIIRIAAALGMSLACSCTEEVNTDLENEIVFGAETSYRNASETKTEYSGELVEEKTYERINWIPGEDRIRILSKQADGGPQRDYLVTDATNAKGERNSQATIKAVDAKLFWGEGEHCFFSLYPAPGMSSKIGGEVAETQTSISLNESGTEAEVKGIIPSEQTGEWVGRIFKPNMNYAYMGASVKASQGEKVTLSFKPLVTTLEFNLHALGEETAAAKLVSLELKSASTKLAGSFSTTLKSDNSHSDPVLSDTEDLIKINLGDGIKLSSDKGSPTRITVLTLPVDQTDLVATMTFRHEDGTEFIRSLALRTKEGEAITVHACKKVYIWNLGVPDDVVIYEFDVKASLEDFPVAPSNPKTYKVTSFKQAAGEDADPVAWSVSFETEDGKRPEWLTLFTESGEGSVEAASYQAICSKNIELSKIDWPEVGENSEMDLAVDLSKKDGLHDSGSQRSTANCYVVTKPGWYKFPAVYGNALVNDAPNLKSYHYVDSEGQVQDQLDGADFRPFFNSLGNTIADPWILTDTNKESAEMEAVLCWQDRENLTSDWFFQKDSDGDYLYFYVDRKTMSYGNAVIALREVGGDILWSWHIWVTFEDPGTTRIEVNPAVEPYTDIRSNQILNSYIGWCEPEEFEGETRETYVVFTQAESGKSFRFKVSQKKSSSHSWGNHPYYQWGRKDPMLPASGEGKNNGKDVDKYQEGKLKWDITKGTDSNNANWSVSRAIREPYLFINAYPWWGAKGTLAKEHRSFWDSGMGDLYSTSAEFSGELPDNKRVDRVVIKTVYDPCPVGFHVANTYAFTIFTTETDLGIYSFEAPDGTSKDHTPLGGMYQNFFNSPNPDDLLIQGQYFTYYSFYCTKDKSTVFNLPATGYRQNGPSSNVTMKAYAHTTGTRGNKDYDASRLYVAKDGASKGPEVHPLSDWRPQYAYGILAAKEGGEVIVTGE